MGARRGDEFDPSDACAPQCLGRGAQRGAGGDHIVDDQHRQVTPRPPGAKSRAGQAIDSGLSGLRAAVRPVQQTPAGHAQLTGDALGDGLRLVVAATPDPPGTGRRPSDEIDVLQLEPAHHLRCDHAGRRTAVTELQGNDQLARHAIERKCSPDAIGATLWTDGRQREPAPVTQHVARTPARSATAGKRPRNQPRNQHGAINTRRV